jgi:hypothetical protein
MKLFAPILISMLLFLPAADISSRNNESGIVPTEPSSPSTEYAAGFLDELYERFPSGSFSRDAFEKALTGIYHLTSKGDLNKPHLLTLIDFSKPSSQDRLFVIDLKRAKILYQSLVAHGRNTGEDMARNFSNTPESYESSPGFYLTAETYQGKHGLSLRLDGLEKGINDKARDRAIVIHGADYVSKEFAAAHGRLGRSQGCPALPRNLTAPVIETIKDGSILFIYAPQTSYLKASTLLQPVEKDCLQDVLMAMEL